VGEEIGTSIGWHLLPSSVSVPHSAYPRTG